MGNTINGNDKRSNRNRPEGGQEEPGLIKSNLQQTSAWSLGSLHDRLNWSFSGKSRSFRSFTKSRNRIATRSNSQQYAKTTWPIPFTDSLFLPHFKRFNKTDSFIVDNVIAAGAFGSVVKVHNKNADNLVYALKVLNKAKIISENSVNQIKEEVEIQKVCSHHPFIVKHVDSWQDRRRLSILLEYIPGGELFSKIRNFPYDLIRLYVAEISLAIDFLHNAGIIYRDVKPENILLSSSYHIKLTDFGLSKWLKFGERTKTMCGTLQYMAPEVLKGEPYGHAVDWWSLGVVACRMLTNKYPNTRVLLPDYVSKDKSRCNSEEVQKCNSSFLSDPFLPTEVDLLPSDTKDLLVRLLECNSQLRLRSVLSLQRIALYKNFKIEISSLLQVSPLEILQKAGIEVDAEKEEADVSNYFNEF